MGTYAPEAFIVEPGQGGDRPDEFRILVCACETLAVLGFLHAHLPLDSRSEFRVLALMRNSYFLDCRGQHYGLTSK
jgi:hypothetical protein